MSADVNVQLYIYTIVSSRKLNSTKVSYTNKYCRLVTDIQQSKIRVSISIGVSLLQPSIISVYIAICLYRYWLICVHIFVLLTVIIIYFIETIQETICEKKTRLGNSFGTFTFFSRIKQRGIFVHKEILKYLLQQNLNDFN